MVAPPRKKPTFDVPSKASPDGLESKWVERWDADATYRFDRSATRDGVFSIDTPPPTASGSLHVGHVFSYTHTDTVARFQRMSGREVFYPMGWDDNGVPTERRVENYFGVLCDPEQAYDPEFRPAAEPPKERRDFTRISRLNFIELCHELTSIDEVAFEDLFRRLGLSVDWSHQYETIGDAARRASQAMFLANLRSGAAYAMDAPCLWDVTYQMAVSQAELEDRERPGAYHDLAFERLDGAGDMVISTTRPELLVSCVALVAHPDDERFRELIGTSVRTPVFGVVVPVVAHHLADPDKGTGAAMICTFGDTTDVTWWRELDLPARAVIQRNGRFRAETPEWIDSEDGAAAYRSLAGATPRQAQRTMVELLANAGRLLGEPQPITHHVKFYERGDAPLEIVQSRQWYLRNGGRDAATRSRLVARGDEFEWHPTFMQARYTDWINGLAGDWLISRQRYFGVAFPLWYPLDADASPLYDEPILAPDHMLPVDPQSEAPPGYDNAQRGQPGGFVGDPDVMDTWATSSLTPQIAGGWPDDPDLFARVFPMDLRPQAHDIIRTWLFSTVVRSDAAFDRAPWRHAALSGWILDPDRKKMSKSKGNVVTPMGLLEEFGSDGVRYWAASGRPGTDTAFDTQQMKVGRRLAIKLMNASRFTLGFVTTDEPDPAAVTEPVDRALLAALGDVVDAATAAFDGFDYARALERCEQFFWSFCDDYLELVKARAYGEGQGAVSATTTLELALSTILRLFAPILPFTCEEVWSWWMDGSIHRTAWPTRDEFGGADSPAPQLLAVASDILREVRKAKTDAKVSMRAEVSMVAVTDSAERLAAFATVRDDLSGAGSVTSWTSAEGSPSVVVTLAEAGS